MKRAGIVLLAAAALFAIWKRPRFLDLNVSGPGAIEQLFPLSVPVPCLVTSIQILIEPGEETRAVARVRCL